MKDMKSVFTLLLKTITWLLDVAPILKKLLCIFKDFLNFLLTPVSGIICGMIKKENKK